MAPPFCPFFPSQSDERRLEHSLYERWLITAFAYFDDRSSVTSTKPLAIGSLRVFVSTFVGSQAEAAVRRSVFRRALRELPTEDGGEMRRASESAG